MNLDEGAATRRRKLELLSIVAPAHNEADNIGRFVAEITSAVSGRFSWELILIDDGSTDHSWSVMLGMSASDARVHCIRLSRNFGKEAAISAGLEASQGDVVVVMDSDLQHPPSLIPQMIARWASGCDVVDGVKRSRSGQSPSLRIASRLFNTMFSKAVGMRIQDATDFKALDRKVVDAWKQMPERTLFFRGMAAWLGYERASVFFEVPDREFGRSAWSIASLFRLAVNGLTSFTSAPLQIVSIIGVGFGLFAVALGAQTLLRWSAGHTVEGFTTVILLLLLIGCAVLLGLGIVGEYVARIHEEVKGRPRYIVAERVGANDSRAGGPD